MKRERDDALKKLDTATKDAEDLRTEGEKLRDMLDEKDERARRPARPNPRGDAAEKRRRWNDTRLLDFFAFLPVPVTSAIFRRFARASVVILE